MTRFTAAVALVAALAAGCGTPQRRVEAPARAAAASGTPAPSASAPPPSPLAPLPAPRQVAVPSGVTAGIVVYDRRTGSYAVHQNASKRFRSASIVKLWITLDLLWDTGPEALTAADRARLDVMLRGSDDRVAIELWRRGGQRAIVQRMVPRLGLVDSAPPPADRPGYWGFTVISPADLVRTYRYLLERAPAGTREYVLGNLRQLYACATDRFDQSFGIAGAFPRPFAVKQGWSGFGDVPARPCASGTAPAPGVPAAYRERANPPGLTDADMAGEVLHTTGTVGADDRVIVVVLSLHPDGTSYANAIRDLTGLTRSLPIPGR